MASHSNKYIGHNVRVWRDIRYLSIEALAELADIYPETLSDIERNRRKPRTHTIQKLAKSLQIPVEALTMPAEFEALFPEEYKSCDGIEGEEVKRKTFLATAGLTAINGLIPTSLKSFVPEEQSAVEWFALRLWQLGKTHLHGSGIPFSISKNLKNHPCVINDTNGYLRLVNPGLLDRLVARRIFADMAGGSDMLLTSVQTSHDTDMAIGMMAIQDNMVQLHLKNWACHGSTAVLRVNAAGILSKVGQPDLMDQAINCIRSDEDACNLYLTAVASRVLELKWDYAKSIVSGIKSRPFELFERLPQEIHSQALQQLAKELGNGRDAAARWCSLVLLTGLKSANSNIVREKIGSILKTEPSCENLRAYALVLSGQSPIH